LHVPSPWQLATALATPDVQLAVPHAVVLPGNVQLAALVPSQLAPHAVPAPVPPHALRAPCGAPSTGKHVPTCPGTSHAAHCEPHALEQQTPSTQKPLSHSLVPAQLVPSGFAHVPAFVGVEQ
jgi:hypothetical protein